MFTANNNSASELIEGGVSTATLVFLNTMVMRTIPWLTLVVPLLIIDGIVGVRASKMRYEKTHNEKDRFTFSRLLRKTVGKVFEYISWCILGSGMAIISNHDWAAWAVLALPFVSELVSIWGHKLELQGVELSISGTWRLIVRKIAEKLGVEVKKEEVEEIIKPKRQRDSKGRFVKTANVKKQEKKNV